MCVAPRVVTKVNDPTASCRLVLITDQLLHNARILVGNLVSGGGRQLKVSQVFPDFAVECLIKPPTLRNQHDIEPGMGYYNRHRFVLAHVAQQQVDLTVSVKGGVKVRSADKGGGP